MSTIVALIALRQGPRAVDMMCVIYGALRTNVPRECASYIKVPAAWVTIDVMLSALRARIGLHCEYLGSPTGI